MAKFQPDWVSCPGDSIADLLDEKGWTQVELAQRMGVSKKHVNELVSGRATLSPASAVALASTLGGDEAFWLTREAQYRASTAHKAHVRSLAQHSEWVKQFPVAWMAKQGWIERKNKPGDKVDACLRFFGAASVQAYNARPSKPMAAFRASESLQDKHGKVAVWLRQAEREATRIDTRPFNKAGLAERLPELRALTLEEPAVFVPSLRALCASVGVAVVLLPHPPSCPIYGVTFWPRANKAVLALSLRYKSNDQLWFSFFHEVGHLLLHGRETFLEGSFGEPSPQEDEANAFAADILIPSAHAAEFRRLKSASAVSAFAARIGTAPGIVVGRLQHDNLLPHNHLNKLKVNYPWEAITIG